MQSRSYAVSASTSSPQSFIDPQQFFCRFGTVLNALFMGALVVQYTLYWTSRSAERDSKGLKALVIFLMVFDVVNFVYDFWFTWV